ncbi:MAG: type IX secretion system membrane protein PorP/SprF, partial [Raineya sp.]
MKKFIFTLLFLGVFGRGFAQDFRYNFHQFNAFAVNPAMAGMQKQLSLGYHSRKQRVEAGLSHRTLMLNVLYPFLKADGEHYGTMGLSLYQDRQNYFGEVNAFDILAATSLNLHQDKKIRLALGLQGGSRSIQDELKGTDYFPAWGAGLMCYQDAKENPYQKRWFVGVAGSNFLGNDRFLENYQFASELRWIFSG